MFATRGNGVRTITWEAGMQIDGAEFTLLKDYDKGKFHLLSFEGKIIYLDNRVRRVLVDPCREAMRTALKTDLGLILATAVCAGISAAGTFLRGRRAKKRGEDRLFFIDFVSEYMALTKQKPEPPGTHWAEWLYSHVRCGLAHNFAIETGGVEYEAKSYTEIKSYGPEISPLELLEDFARGWMSYLEAVRSHGKGVGLGQLFEGRFDQVFVD